MAKYLSNKDYFKYYLNPFTAFRKGSKLVRELFYLLDISFDGHYVKPEKNAFCYLEVQNEEFDPMVVLFIDVNISKVTVVEGLDMFIQAAGDKLSISSRYSPCININDEYNGFITLKFQYKTNSDYGNLKINKEVLKSETDIVDIIFLENVTDLKLLHTYKSKSEIHNATYSFDDLYNDLIIIHSLDKNGEDKIVRVKHPVNINRLNLARSVNNYCIYYLKHKWKED